MVLLIIDDSDIFRGRLIELLSEALEIEKYLEANNIIDAIKILATQKPDLIITDVRMPGGSGLEFLRNLRAQNNAVKIAVVTNFPENEYRNEAIKLGANWFFDKSKDIENLVNVIGSISVNI